MNSLFDIGMASYLLTILLNIALIILVIMGIILVYRLIKMVEYSRSSIDKINQTLDLTNLSLNKAQVPLDTIVKVSHTVDDIHDAGVTAFKNTRDYLAAHIVEIKEKIQSGIEGVGTFVKNKTNNKGDQNHE